MTFHVQNYLKFAHNKIQDLHISTKNLNCPCMELGKLHIPPHGWKCRKDFLWNVQLEYHKTVSFTVKLLYILQLSSLHSKTSLHSGKSCTFSIKFNEHKFFILSFQWLRQYFMISFLGHSQSKISFERDPILNSYTAVDILNWRWSELYAKHHVHSCILQEWPHE